MLLLHRHRRGATLHSLPSPPQARGYEEVAPESGKDYGTGGGGGDDYGAGPADHEASYAEQEAGQAGFGEHEAQGQAGYGGVDAKE